MIPEGIAAKVIGVVAGAFLALVFDPPRSRSGFVRRTAVAFVGGYIFGHLVLKSLGWDETWDNIIAAWCLSSYISWYVMGRVKKFVQNYRKET